MERVNMAGAGGSVLSRLMDEFVIPVVRASERRLARTAIDWLAEEGFRTFEITMTVPEAIELIEETTGRGLLVGAGTVLDAATAERCIAAGARYVVSPANLPAVAAACRGAGVVSMLGALTPTEVMAALAAGADAVKVFPASSMGGPSHIKALRAVFPNVLLVPTGGIDAEDIPAYRAAGAALVGLGGKLVDETALLANDRASIAAAARRVLQQIGRA
ncbi:MAG TPA: bifunctional 4-hydroxy-2-oxoglutarate aldolase/2-dehydro-3-deoxy-phosphogluconate aldolase [Alphaproteobacteria bacterium]